MYRNIFEDFLRGLLNSLRLDYLVKLFLKDFKLKNLIIKICKYNFLMHFLPTIIMWLLNWSIGINLYSLLDVIIYPINLFSALFHLLHYMDLANIVCTHTSKTSNTVGGLDLISLAITMTIYQFIIFSTTMFINLIFSNNMYLISFIINFFVLTIYHSFYYFNNLWQYKKIEMAKRIDMHEKLWAYYTGYGLISTIIYLYIDSQFILGLYNLYMALMIALPFLIEPIYPKKIVTYPSINLTIFSYITNFVFMLSKKIIDTFSN